MKFDMVDWLMTKTSYTNVSKRVDELDLTRSANGSSCYVTITALTDKYKDIYFPHITDFIRPTAGYRIFY